MSFICIFYNTINFTGVFKKKADGHNKTNRAIYAFCHHMTFKVKFQLIAVKWVDIDFKILKFFNATNDRQSFTCNK